MEKVSEDYDALTGVLTRTGFVEDKLVIRKDSDLSGVLAYTNALRNDEEYSRQGIKKGWFHAATIPEVVQIELLQNGIDIYRAPIKDIMAGLRKLGKDHFITTRKRV